MHPDMFSAFVDIAGDIAPNSGTKAQTIDRLFGGNAAAYAAFDPATVITKHGYQNVSGWFAIRVVQPINSAVANVGATGLGGRANPNPGDQTAAANTLCALGSANGIDCAVVAQPGKTVLDTSTSFAPAFAAIRAAMWTAIPPMSSPIFETLAGVQTAAYVETDLRHAFGERHRHQAALLGPSRMSPSRPSPVCFTSRPWNDAILARATSSWR